EWKGSFYPPKLPTAKWLEYYAQQLGAVEINYTFYRTPNAKTVAGWNTATPEGFTFVLKAPQRITHYARLRNIDESLRFFCDTVRKLNTKLGAVLFQLPPNFKKDLARLGDLLTQFPTDVRAACEFRHASWWSDDVYDLLPFRRFLLAKTLPQRLHEVEHLGLRRLLRLLGDLLAFDLAIDLLLHPLAHIVLVLLGLECVASRLVDQLHGEIELGLLHVGLRNGHLCDVADLVGIAQLLHNEPPCHRPDHDEVLLAARGILTDRYALGLLARLREERVGP